MSVFVKASKTTKAKKQSQTLSDPIIMKNFIGKDNSIADLWIVAEKFYGRAERDAFASYMRSNFVHIKYVMISAVCLEMKEKDEEKAIKKFYTQNRVRLEKYIPRGSKIISIGRAIYSICQSDDLTVGRSSADIGSKSIISGFYDTLIWRSYFFSPDLKAKVWPIDGIRFWSGKDNFARWFVKEQIERAFKDNYVPIRQKPVQLIEVENPNKWLLDRINGKEKTAFDTETKGLNPWALDGKIICLTLAFDGHTGYYLDWDKIDVNILEQFLKGRPLITQNGKYDKKWLVVKAGINFHSINLWGDTMHLTHTINEMRRMGLKSGVWTHTEDLGGYDRELDLYIEKYPSCKTDYSLIPFEILFPYATTDAPATFRMHDELLIELRELQEKVKPEFCHTYLRDSGSNWTLERWYFKIVMPSINTFCQMEIHGSDINWDEVDKLSVELDISITEVEDKLYKQFNLSRDNFNIHSNSQVGDLLESLEWHEYSRGKNGKYNVNAYTLRRWKEEGHIEAEWFIKLHELQTLMKTFVGRRGELVKKKVKGAGSGYYQYMQPDGKVHANFGPCLTDSNRNWCRDPNLMNLPKRSKGDIDYAKRIRTFFIPPSRDYLVSEEDGAGLQLRIEASLTNDPAMRDVFQNRGGDMHSMTAQDIFRRDVTLDTFIKNKNEKGFKEYRYKSKAVNFSLIFNTTAFSFAAQSIEPEWTIEECTDYIRDNLLEDRREDLFNKIRETGQSDGFSIEEDRKFSYYWAVAEDIQEKFMLKYAGVKDYMDYIIKFASQKGYVVSPFGCIRRLPYLLIEGLDTNGAKFKNAQNIATNSPVQAVEVYVMLKSMNAMQKYIWDNDLKTILWGQVHDSMVSYPHKDEVYQLAKVSKEAFEEDEIGFRGIPYELELEVGDYWNEEYWGFSPEVKLEEIKEKY